MRIEMPWARNWWRTRPIWEQLASTVFGLSIRVSQKKDDLLFHREDRRFWNVWKGAINIKNHFGHPAPKAKVRPHLMSRLCPEWNRDSSFFLEPKCWPNYPRSNIHDQCGCWKGYVWWLEVLASKEVFLIDFNNSLISAQVTFFLISPFRCR